jgi:type II secretory pathway pseudopilin PulG
MIPQLARATRRFSGYTAIEFILVIAITGILVVGLAAIVDMPAEVVQRQEDGRSMSSIDQAMAVFDKDVRFAIDARSPDANTLELTTHGGGTVTWQWSGTAGAPLTRTDVSGTVAVVPNTRALTFAIKQTNHRVATVTNVDTVKTDTVGASFSSFAVKPGYQLLAVGESVLRGLLGVTETVGTRSINATSNVGLFFKVPAGAQDQSYPSSITVRMSRAASADVLVRLYEADAVTRAPQRANAVGMAYVRNADIPATMSDVTIRLSPLKRVSGTGSYFVDFVGRGAGNAANFEFRKLSLDLAPVDWGGGLLYSTTSGASYAPISSLLSNSQTKFSFTLTKEKDADALDANDTVTSTTLDIPTGVALDLAIQGEGGGDRTLRVSVPIENNVQFVNQ